MGVKMTMTLNDKFTKQLKGLELTVEKDILRPAARAGALVFYELIHANVPYKDGKLLNAIYHAFMKEEQTNSFKSYRVGVNGAKGSSKILNQDGNVTKTRPASHWWWLEFGRMQRYAVRKTKDGDFVTLVRPSRMKDKPPNPRKASQAEMDAYYIPLKGGPRHIPGLAYIRRTYLMGRKEAGEAVIQRAREKLREYLANKRVVNSDVD